MLVKLLSNVTSFAQSAGTVQRSKTPFNECPRYDTKQSDGEVTVMLEHKGIRIFSVV